MKFVKIKINIKIKDNKNIFIIKIFVNQRLNNIYNQKNRKI